MLDVLATPALGEGLSVVAVLRSCSRDGGWRRPSHESEALTTMLALVLTVILVIIPSFAPYNQVLLLPPYFSSRSRGEICGAGEGLRAGLWSELADGRRPWIACFRLMRASRSAANELAPKSLGHASVSEPRHSPGGFGIAKRLRRRSMEGMRRLVRQNCRDSG